MSNNVKEARKTADLSSDNTGVLSLSKGPILSNIEVPQGKGMFVPFPRGCIVNESVLES